MAHPARANEAKLRITVTAALRLRDAGLMSVPSAFRDGQVREELEARADRNRKPAAAFRQTESHVAQLSPLT